MARDSDPKLPHRLEKVLAGLPPITREIFLAHRLDDQSYETIAARMGLTAREVERHIAKALVHLDRQLNAPPVAWRGRLFVWLRRRLVWGERKGG